MAQPISNATQSPKVEQTTAPKNAPAPKAPAKSASAPEDQVTISTAGHAAQQASQPQETGKK